MILGIGNDIVEIERIAKKKDRHAKRILTAKEKAIYDLYNEKRQAEFLAGRFAAKEAIFKALPSPNVVLSQIEVLMDKNGKPFCLHDHYKINISIAHEQAYAIAYAIVED